MRERDERDFRFEIKFFAWEAFNDEFTVFPFDLLT